MCSGSKYIEAMAPGCQGADTILAFLAAVQEKNNFNRFF